MVIERFPPDDPREWMVRAQSNLRKARARVPGVLLEDLLFDAQQAAEKAIKAVFVLRDMEHPKIHDLGRLLLQLERSGVPIPPNIQRASQLTVYAVETRYPEEAEHSVTVDEYTVAMAITEAVVAWAQNLVQNEFTRTDGSDDT